MNDARTRLTAALADRYRIARELGAGGMATVYLAQDLKHDRQVAVKVLKPELAVAIGAERFLAEIKTTANLQHPHILALHDSGEVNGTVFYVMPYVDGESLRDRLDREKQLPIDDALRIAGEVGDALQYAHERGVIHRDIKPENILLQRGHAVVADFGIALAASKSGGSRMTETGMSLGTPTYMSPEQAMGAREIDARTDVYSLGCVLYEMLAGEPPFVGPTAQAIVAKVITESPKSLTAQRHTVPLHVDAAVQTALEKLAADRFASTGAFVQALRSPGATSHGVSHRSVRDGMRPPSARSRVVKTAGAALGIAVLVVAAYIVGRGSGTSNATNGASMQQMTYRTQAIFSARYASDGASVVYSAAEGGSTPRIYTITSANPIPRVVADSGTHLLAVSSKDEMAVLVGATYLYQRVFIGTLARMPVGGGTPRELLTSVRDADWTPDGSQLAVVHEVNGKNRLEYPIGTVLYETPGYLSDLRMSPDGQRLAFAEHPERGDDRGVIAVVDLKGGHTVLTPAYFSLEGLSWTGGSERLVFAGSANGEIAATNEVTLAGKVFPGSAGVGSATIHDVARDGRQLIMRDDRFSRLWMKHADRTVPLDLSWLNRSFWPLLSDDASLMAFGDASGVAGSKYAVMLRRTDGSGAVRLGEGAPLGMSHDNQWVLSAVPSQPAQLMLYPTGAGASRRLDKGEFVVIGSAAFLGSGRDIMACATEAKQGARCFVRSLDSGTFRPFTPEGVSDRVVAAPDGRHVIAQIGGRYLQFSVQDGSSQPVAGLTSSDQVLRYSPDGQTVWTWLPNSQPVRIERVDLSTGARSLLLPEFSMPRAGLLKTGEVTLSDDPRSYLYLEGELSTYLFELRKVP